MNKSQLLLGGTVVVGGVVIMPFATVTTMAMLGGSYILYNMLRSSNPRTSLNTSENVSETLTLSANDELREET